MTFSALDSELTGALFATAEMRAVFSDRARLAAMLRVEAALARAEAARGLVPKMLALAIERIKAEDLNLAALGAMTANAGVPTIPFIKAVEAKLPAKLRPAFHFGATSQDIVDTALALQMVDGLNLIADDVAAIVAGLAKLARSHRKTPCVGRTFGQHAAPMTFGFAVATWLSGVVQVAVGLPRVRERALVASLGGPVGTLSALGDKGPAVLEAFAKDLGLAAPTLSWHTTRVRIAENGAWLAILIGALAKMATDVVHLSSTEVGEVAEAHVAGRGGSSAMPHKRNPVGATVILAAHGAAKGHVVTLLDAMAAADQRPAGAWHAEWHALPELFGLASGALREARRIAEGLVVDKKRMRENLGLTRGLLFADAVAALLAPKLGREATHRFVEKAADKVRTSGKSLREVLKAEASIPAALQKTLDRAFDLAPSTNASAVMTDRVLAGVKSSAPLLRKRR